jgi:hypothetical protein
MWFKKTVGVDIVDVKRFEEYTDNKEHHFLKKVFTPYEIDYCFIHKEPAKHLAGLFTAKVASRVLRYDACISNVSASVDPRDKSTCPASPTSQRCLPPARCIPWPISSP